MDARTAAANFRRPALLPRFAVVLVCALTIGAGKPTDPKKTAAAAAAQTNGVDTRAERAILIDAGSGSVIFEKKPDETFPPAGLAKLMTLTVAAREAKEGRLSLDGEFTVSEHAWRTGGAPSRTTTMFAPVNTKARVSDLFRGVMIQMANDGAIALAEGIAGSETAFAELMNKQAADLGLKATRFTNPTGRPGGDDITTARDMSILARHFVSEYPDLYKIWGEREFTYNKIRQTNRNPVLDGAVGGDGMQTTSRAEVGMPIVASAQQGQQRLILVLAGLPGEKERAEDARKILDWGFRTFETLRLYKAGETVGEATVYGGQSRSVKIAAIEDVEILVPRGARDKLRGRVVYTGPLPAPVAKGARVGRLILSRGDQVIREVPVETIEEVPVGRILARAVDGTRELLLGVFPPMTTVDAAAIRPSQGAATRGRFITFEGGEGAGKSSQVAHLAEELRGLGHEVVVTREPGGSPGAECVRHALLSGAAEAFGALAEACLFAAARADHVDQTIRPALAAGKWVISDRFHDSSRVYQGLGGEVPAPVLRLLEDVAVDGTRPDLTLLLDVPADVGLARAHARRGAGDADRFEREAISIHERRRLAFLSLARAEPDRFVVIDATDDPATVAAAIWLAVRDRLAPERVAAPVAASR